MRSCRLLKEGLSLSNRGNRGGVMRVSSHQLFFLHSNEPLRFLEIHYKGGRPDGPIHGLVGKGS